MPLTSPNQLSLAFSLQALEKAFVSRLTTENLMAKSASTEGTVSPDTVRALDTSHSRRLFYKLSQFSFKAYEPWAQKMSGADRLAIRCSGQPPLPQLAWTNALGDIWIGRLTGKK